jgi:hypothetical protein
MATKDNYQLLIEKLDQFIRKYYINQAIRGTLYSIAVILAVFLLFNLLEYQYFFDVPTRKVLFFTFLGISLLALGFWVFTPLLHYFRLGRVISHEQAARIVGSHFSEVEDKLLNVLHLKRQSDSVSNCDLILASINQKTEELKPVPFQKAINLGQNRKYLRYALPPLLLLLVLLFAAPSVIRDSTHRLINNNETFEKPAPFQFLLAEKQPAVVQYEDYPLQVRVDGQVIPDQVFIEVEGYQYRMRKTDAQTFEYRFNNVQKDQDFRLSAAEVVSPTYTLSVLRKPNITAFEVELDYPDYTGRRDESLSNVGDLSVPTGTVIQWAFQAEHTEDIGLYFSGQDERLAARRSGENYFTYQKQAFKAELYKLFMSNQALKDADSITYSLAVVPDLHPSIQADEFRDSSMRKVLFFIGEASDDYGLQNLSFNYRIVNSEGEEGPLQTVGLGSPAGKKTSFDHVFDLNELNLKPGEEVNYYFEVYDNDAIYGSKVARTQVMRYAMPTVEEFEAMAEQNDEDIKNNLENAVEESKKIQDELQRAREKLLQEEELDWQTRKDLEKLMERQKELQEQMDEARKKFEENRQNEEEYKQPNENLDEKQDQLEKLFEESMDQEMQELLEQIQQLMEELDKDQALEMMEEMKYQDQEMEMEMERLLELYKQLELEKEVLDAVENLEELAREEQELSEQTKAENAKTEELQQKQEEILEKFDELQQKMEDIEQKNQELENPKNLGDPQEQMEDIQLDMKRSQQQMQQQQNQKASESQKNAAEKMQEMAEEMANDMQAGQMQQMQEDIESLRQLLENLVGLSFDQEDLIDAFSKTNLNTPRYVGLIQEQFKLKDDFALVEDSLQALSKRVFQIESFVTEKVSEINGNIRQSLEDLEERRLGQATDHQQRSMKNINDLALMLSEVMNQMQQQLSSKMKGQQMCSKPNSSGQQGRKPMDKIVEGQKKLNEDMRNAMEKRKQQQGKQGDGGSAREYAEMARRQAELRRAMEEKQKELRQQGKGNPKLQELIEQMDKVETDLVNKKLTNEMMMRQKDILNRLLEHEKAEREQEYEEKRKSETARETERQMPPALEEYLRQRKAEVEQYKTVSPNLKPYYKTLVEQYLNSLQTD